MLLFILCATFICQRGVQLWLKFGYMPREWMALWVNLFGLGLPPILAAKGFVLFKYLFGGLFGMKRRVVLGSTAAMDPFTGLPAHSTHSARDVYAGVETHLTELFDGSFSLHQIVDVALALSLVITFIVALVLPPLLRFVTHYVLYTYSSTYRNRWVAASDALVAYKYGELSNLNAYHNMQTILQCIHLTIAQGLLYALNLFVLDNMLYKIAWFAIWADQMLYTEISLECLRVDFRADMQMWPVAWKRLLAHFWGQHINRKLNAREFFSFGSLYWTYRSNPSNAPLIKHIPASETSKALGYWRSIVTFPFHFMCRYFAWSEYTSFDLVHSLDDIATDFEGDRSHRPVSNQGSTYAADHLHQR
jgi:hypothetical protein